MSKESDTDSILELAKKSLFCHRIVIAEPYIADPNPAYDLVYSSFRGTEIKKVPIIRIYGSTPKGQKTCANIHGVFPYIYVLNDPSIQNFDYRLATSLDAAINASYGTQHNSRQQYVFKIIKTKGRNFYGFHLNETSFFKIYFYTHKVISKATELLQSGTILDRKFQTFESHIPYVLQFFIDFNLYGMNMIHYLNVRFRHFSFNSIHNEEASSSASSIERYWNLEELSSELSGPPELMKTSLCELEIDVKASDIIIFKSRKNEISNPGIDAIWLDEKERRKNYDVDSNISIPISQDRPSLEIYKTESAFKEELIKKLNNIEDLKTRDEHRNKEIENLANSSDLDLHLPDESFFIPPDIPEESHISPVNDESFLALMNEMANDKEEEELVGIDQEFDSILNVFPIPPEDESELENKIYPQNLHHEPDEVKWEKSFFSTTINLANEPEEISMDEETNKDGTQNENENFQNTNEDQEIFYPTCQVNEPNGKLVSNLFSFTTRHSRNSVEIKRKRIKRRNPSNKQIDESLKIPQSIKRKYKKIDLLREITKANSSDKEIGKSSLSPSRKPSKKCYKYLKKKLREVELACLRPDPFEDWVDEWKPIKKPPSFQNVKSFLHLKQIESKRTKVESKVVENQNTKKNEEIPIPIKFKGVGALSQSLNLSEAEEELSQILSNSINSSSEVKEEICSPLSGKVEVRWSDDVEKSNTQIVVPSSRIARKVSSDSFSSSLRKQAIVKSPVESSMKLKKKLSKKPTDSSELDGPTLDNTFGFKHDVSNLQDSKAIQEHQYLTVMSIEVHCEVRGDLLPDPAIDPIQAIFIYSFNDVPIGNNQKQHHFELISVCLESLNESQLQMPIGFEDYNCTFYPDENSLINAFILTIRKFDPDILVGYEIQKMSLGYIIDRGNHLGINLVSKISRIPSEEVRLMQNEWNEFIPGRIVLNLWRILRHEITVQSYTFESAVFHILHERFPLFSFKNLWVFWCNPVTRFKTLRFYRRKVEGVIRIIEEVDLINRTSELARLFGIQFFEVLSRGSQFRVESMMLRLAKPANLIPVSPTVQQRGKMKAPEFLPLILEPYSNYYRDPVAVLDFQSLYPSMIIAYNYDFSTCLGRIEHLGKEEPFDFGCTSLEVQPSELAMLRDQIHFSPAGVAFVRKEVRRGILPKMLEQILDARLMVKRAMKKWKGDQFKGLLKILDSRQLGLKLIANVTYGYTSANFSGRMPSVEVADSVVSKGRETLQRAISLVKENEAEWGARVVYGDTDSMFLLFPGMSKDKAFKIANLIADEVTKRNPKPVKLKFEKIYQPCILQSKKRYVGYAYETPDQSIPKYDAKGIETVRRDGCPAIAKILEKTIRTLFETNCERLVRNYIEFQFKKIFLGRVSLSEYTYAREFRGRAGYKPGACVPSLEIAKKATEHDPRAEPLTSERVPYIVIYGDPGLPLIQLIRSPTEYRDNPGLRLNAHYYIEKGIIPALNRCLNLAKMSVQTWYLELPRKYLKPFQGEGQKKERNIVRYMENENCVICDGKSQNEICEMCFANKTETTLTLVERAAKIEKRFHYVSIVCSNCSLDNKCINFTCPVQHKVIRYGRDILELPKIRRLIEMGVNDYQELI